MKKQLINQINESLASVKTLDDLKTVTELLETRKNYLEMVKNAYELTKKDFGFLKEAFEMMSPALYKTADGKNIIKKYINEVKNSPELKQAYSIYENICHAEERVNATDLVNRFTGLNISAKRLSEASEKLGSIVAEGFIALNGDFDLSQIPENKELNESVNYLMTSSDSLSNMGRVSVCAEMVKDFINENKGSKTRSKQVKNGDIDSLLKEFNEKYANSEYSGILKEAASGSKEMYDTYKEKCLDAINETIKNGENDVNIDRMKAIREAVEKKEYNKDNVALDVANFIKLTETVLK